MGVKIGSRQAVHPARTRANPARAEEYFYAAEAVRVLGVDGIEYRQLRELLALVRGPQAEQASARWARYSLADIAGLQIAIQLVGGGDVFQRGRRMRLAALATTLKALRDAGFSNPLIQVPLRLVGTKVVAQVDGILFDPTTGQTLLRGTADRLEDHLRELAADGLIQDAEEAVSRLRDELATLRSGAVSQVAGRTEVVVTSAPLQTK